jgi:hypothetical protein
MNSISAKKSFAGEGPRLVNLATLPRSAMLAPTAPRFLEFWGGIFAAERATPAFTPWHKDRLVLFESHLFPTRSANLALFEKLNESQFTLQFYFRHPSPPSFRVYSVLGFARSAGVVASIRSITATPGRLLSGAGFSPPRYT